MAHPRASFIKQITIPAATVINLGVSTLAIQSITFWGVKNDGTNNAGNVEIQFYDEDNAEWKNFWTLLPGQRFGDVAQLNMYLHGTDIRFSGTAGDGVRCLCGRGWRHSRAQRSE